MGRYADAFQQSLVDPEAFWGQAARAIDWYHEPTIAPDMSRPPFCRWFADGVLNTGFSPETYRWSGDLLGVPVIDHWRQTETGWPIAADLMGLEPMATKPGSPTMPVPGYDVRILDAETGLEVPAGVTGEMEEVLASHLDSE